MEGSKHGGYELAPEAIEIYAVWQSASQKLWRRGEGR